MDVARTPHTGASAADPTTAKRVSAVRSTLWAMNSLVGKNALQLGIPDTILLKDGAPQAWLFTSKSGQVLKKRSIRKSTIQDRFLRLYASNAHNPEQRVATVRFMDGTVRNIGMEPFREMMVKFPATEPGILCVQSFMQGKGIAGTVYRNTYRVVNDKGLSVTATSSFTTLRAEHAMLPSSAWSEREIKLDKCSASTINNALDAVTLGIVRCLESSQERPTRIIRTHCDYVIDEADQIWFTWIADTTVAVAGAAQDLRLADVASEGPRGRGDFLGSQTALAMQRAFGGPPLVHKRSGHCHDRSANRGGHGASTEAIEKAIDEAAQVTELPQQAVGAGGDGGIADALNRAEAAAASSNARSSSLTSSTPSALTIVRRPDINTSKEQKLLSTMTVVVRDGEAADRGRSGSHSGKGFPSSFACAGDFCTLRVMDPREDAGDPRHRKDTQGSLLHPDVTDQDFFTEVATRLFSGQELSALRRDASFRRQIEEGLVMNTEAVAKMRTEGLQGASVAAGTRSGDAGRGCPAEAGPKHERPRTTFEVSWKSISLARRSRGRPARKRTHEEVIGREPATRLQEESTRGTTSTNTSACNGQRAEEGCRLHHETEASAMRQHARRREDVFLDGGAQNFYKPVRVCASCFRVYALLDKARGVLARQEKVAAIQARLHDKSDCLSPATRDDRTHRRQRRKRGRHTFSRQGGYGSAETASLSSDEIQARHGALAAHSSAMLPARPRSQGDGGSFADRRGMHSAQRSLAASGSESNGSLSTPTQLSRGGRGKPRTWRGRLEDFEHEGGSGIKQGVSSGRKFEDLDSYLRGCAKVVAGERGKHHRQKCGGAGRTMAGRNVSDTAGSLTDSYGTSASTAGAEEPQEEDEEGSALFHARVLLAEADTASAKRTSSMLEQAGFMVVVEQDGKQVVECLIDGDGDWDALIVERDMPVMDGFEITKAMRDFEKTRRNRSSVARASAVEKFARADQPTNTQGMAESVRAPSAVPEAAEVRHLPIICLTSKASPEDLRSYMAVGMDGCVSKPAESGPLLNTLRAAVPLHLSPASAVDGRPVAHLTGGGSTGAGRGGGMKVLQGKGLGVLKGSAACAAAGMVLSKQRDDCIEGALQVDADTFVPYCVVGSPPPLGGERSARFFNLVICHDLFDNYERMKIVVAPVVARYPGAQVLLWNYPGQAFSEWRDQQLLNNEYMATILQYLLLHLGKKNNGGTGDFDSDRPFHLTGFGAGGSVATFYASHFAKPVPRSLILLNSFSYVDAYLAGVLHDCMNVFSCAPESRPDLPVYFHSRFLFSPAYLGQVSTPLALNIYTAVHNPISVKGRMQLCKGALANIDTRPVLSEIDVPVICIQSTQNNFVKPLHTDPYVSRRGGEVRSIHKALQNPGKTCVIWMNAGHEVFQEARAQTTTFLEQAIAGYHEANDVVYSASHPEFMSTTSRRSICSDSTARRKSKVDATNLYGAKTSTKGGAQSKSLAGGGSAFEDKYIDSVLSTMSDIESEARHRERGILLPAASSVVDGAAAGSGDGRNTREQGKQREDDNGTEIASAWDGSLGEVYGSNWESYRENVAAAAANSAARSGRYASERGELSASDEDMASKRYRGGCKPYGRGRRRRSWRRERVAAEDQGQGRNIMVGTVLDACHPAFERQDNLVYGFGQGSKVYPRPQEYPEVKEYMAWRLKRNRKRLVRLDRAARRIQGVLRGFLAFKRAQALRESRACVCIQRVFRGWQGRLSFLEKLRSVWAAQIVQRNWRGHASRRWFQLLRRQQAACGHMQRVWRGAIVRRRVQNMRRRRDRAAALMQALWRGVSGRRRAFLCREEKNGAITIQRVFRGHIGRRRAGRERDKYLFSKSQSQGIDFGRQMLLEHKLHATRLQSDVQLLTGEKVSAEEAVEAMMEEISEFEEAVAVLEKEMHQLSKIETEAVGVLDEDARLELREQKVRLDKEFGEMLGKIADRKDRLLHMEKKLATLDRTRLGKEEELRTLERKLVVLLEEQQRELENIRRRQEKKGMLLLSSSGGGGADGPGDLVCGGSSGGGGPSAKDKRQAAQLMQSTETLMKFGFMSMSMTYFSSLNMIRAMRSVGASDTVMAALAHNANAADAHGAAGGDKFGGASHALALEQNEKLGSEPFRPALKPGQLPGQEPLAVYAWSVDDVARWLQTLTLTQYREAFISAAVDGAFLYDLNDDDLKSSLGVEHRLHRKKILNSILRLKAAEAERKRPAALNAAMSSRHGTAPSEMLHQHPFDQTILGDAAEALGPPHTGDSTGPAGEGLGAVAVPIHFKELVVLTRRGKYKQIREILEPLPNRRFDATTVRVPYVADYGTVYVDAYEQEPFNLNKTDDHGNTLLMVAAQNGNIKIAKLYIYKGANPNHQNKAGQTAGHYAVSYQFFDLSEWLFLPEDSGGGADDTIENSFGLGPYDGLQPDTSVGGASASLMLESGA